MTKPIRAIPPHGGTLIDRGLRGMLREVAIERAAHLPRLTLNPVNLSDLELIGNGAFSPLTGFMGEADYLSVVEEMWSGTALSPMLRPRLRSRRIRRMERSRVWMRPEPTSNRAACW